MKLSTKRRDSRGRFLPSPATADFGSLELKLLLAVAGEAVRQLKARLPRHNTGRWTAGARNYHEWGQ